MKKEKIGERGYTLIEIIAVLALLAFIMTLVAPSIVGNLQKGQISAAKTQINATESVLNSYYLDNSAYPTTEQGLKALIEKPSIPPVPENWNGPYMEKKKVPQDPWGHELRYISPGVHNPQSYDLFTLGRDNAEGGSGSNAEIGNW